MLLKFAPGSSGSMGHLYFFITLTSRTSDDENYPRQRRVIDGRSLKTTAARGLMSAPFTQTWAFHVKTPAAFKYLPLIENGKQSLLIDSLKGEREEGETEKEREIETERDGQAICFSLVLWLKALEAPLMEENFIWFHWALTAHQSAEKWLGLFSGRTDLKTRLSAEILFGHFEYQDTWGGKCFKQGHSFNWGASFGSKRSALLLVKLQVSPADDCLR